MSTPTMPTNGDLTTAIQLSMGGVIAYTRPGTMYDMGRPSSPTIRSETTIAGVCCAATERRGTTIIPPMSSWCRHVRCMECEKHRQKHSSERPVRAISSSPQGRMLLTQRFLTSSQAEILGFAVPPRPWPSRHAHSQVQIYTSIRVHPCLLVTMFNIKWIPK
jgi:hypothetical protein